MNLQLILLSCIQKKVLAAMTAIFTLIQLNAQNITHPNIVGPSGLQVNSYTGSLFLQRSDFVLPGRGIPIDFTFSYNSSDRKKNWGYGNGFTLKYTQSYTRDSLGNILIIREDGRKDKFIKSSTGYIAPIGVFDSLIQYATGKLKLINKSKTQYFFDDSSSKKLTSIVDRNNNDVKLLYTGGNLTSVTDASGRTFTLLWNSGLLVELRTEFSSPVRSIKYDYDKLGFLIAVHGPSGNVIKYSYGANRALNSITDANGNSSNIIYNANNAVVKFIACNSEKTITYNKSENKVYETDKNENSNVTTIYGFDSQGRLINKTGYCCGYKTTVTYDNNDNILSVTNANGFKTTYTYDNMGNMLSETDAENNVNTFTYEAELNNLSSKTDKNGNKTTFVYDNRGNLIQMIEPLGRTIQFNYDEISNRIGYIDARGNKISYSYDSYGNIISQKDAMGGVITYKYDIFGNNVEKKDQKGNSIEYSYDLLNRLTGIKDVYGNVIGYAYDGNGNIISITDAKGNVTSYIYNDKNKPVTITNAEGKSTYINYDVLGNIKSITDVNGGTSQYFYDNLNRLVSETNAVGESTSYDYDGNGNRTSVTYPNGNIVSYTYDKLNRVVSIKDKLGLLYTYTYDPKGNKLTQTNSNGYSFTYKYDALDRLISQTDPSGSSYKNEFDLNNNLIREIDRNGKTISYTYDALNRCIKKIDALDNTSAYQYDPIGNLTTIVDAKNNTTKYTYDGLSRIIEEKLADNSSQLFSYDASSNIISRRDFNGETILYEYDKLNRNVLRRYANTIDTFKYDGLGNMIAAKNSHANILFQYDQSNRLIKETLNGKSTIYSYNTANGFKNITYPSGKLVKQYVNARNQLLGLYDINERRIAEFKYNDAGELIQKSYANNTFTDIHYNGNSQIVSLSQNPSSFFDIEYSYDKEGDPVSVNDLNFPGRSEQYSYDSNNQLTLVASKNSALSFNYDNSGNRIASNLNGQTTTYTTNNLNAYTNISSNSNVDRTYDANGNLRKEGQREYFYDLENRLIKVSEGSTIGLYSYDPLGRRIQKITSSDTINFYYSGNQIIEEQDQRGFLRASYVWGTSTDNIICMSTNGSDYFYQSIINGSVSNITDSTGTVIERYEYDPFGNFRIYDNKSTNITKSTINNSYTFTGREYDSEIGLYFYRRRNYNSADGHFLQRDPKRFIDGLNLYTYVNNNPLRYTDPNGTNTTNPSCGVSKPAPPPPIPSDDPANCKSFYSNPVISNKAAPPWVGSTPFFVGNAIAACEGTGNDETIKKLRKTLQEYYLNRMPKNGSYFTYQEHQDIHKDAYSAAQCSGTPAPWFGWMAVDNLPGYLIPGAIPLSIEWFGNCKNPNIWNNGKGLDENLSDILVPPAY